MSNYIISDIPIDLQNQIAIIGRQIGDTPLLPIKKIFQKKGVEIYAKAEYQQLSGSVKARAAFNIFKDAIDKGVFEEGRTLLDASSGNTAIAYAIIGNMLHLPVSICIPKNASAERKKILEVLGVEIIYTSEFGGTDEAQETASFLSSQYPNRYYYANQYANEQNWKAHYDNTAPEIYRQKSDITHFVAGLGTTGTFVGVSKKLKIINPAIKTIALQPDLAMHGLEGWKHLETAVVPSIFEPDLVDEYLSITTSEAYQTLVDVARKEGLLLSPSAAANLAGAIKIANSAKEAIIVTVFPDNADKYSEIIKKIL